MARRVSEPLTGPPIRTGRFTTAAIRLLGDLTISNIMQFHSSAYTYTASSTVFQNDVEMQILDPNGQWASWTVLPRA